MIESFYEVISHWFYLPQDTFITPLFSTSSVKMRYETFFPVIFPHKNRVVGYKTAQLQPRICSSAMRYSTIHIIVIRPLLFRHCLFWYVGQRPWEKQILWLIFLLFMQLINCIKKWFTVSLPVRTVWSQSWPCLVLGVLKDPLQVHSVCSLQYQVELPTFYLAVIWEPLSAP